MTTKELKELYHEELKKAWSSPNMVEHCSKQATQIFEHDGHLFSLDKPSIETHFCFGHGFCGITTQEDEERADSMAEHARTNTDYFISENLSDINRMLQTLHDIREEMGYNWAEGSMPRYMIAWGGHWSGQTDDCKIWGFSVVKTWDYLPSNGWQLCNDVEFIDKLINAYEQQKVDFTKRLNTYLKRYGLSKVHSWSYLSD